MNKQSIANNEQQYQWYICHLKKRVSLLMQFVMDKSDYDKKTKEQIIAKFIAIMLKINLDKNYSYQELIDQINDEINEVVKTYNISVDSKILNESMKSFYDEMIKEDNKNE